MLTVTATVQPIALSTEVSTLEQPVLGLSVSAEPVSPTITQTATLAPSETPIPLPTETEIVLPTETETVLPTNGPSPTRTRRPTLTPTITPTPDLPLSAIVLASPGQLSKVRSPIHVQAAAIPGEDGMIRVELMGEDGTLIARQVLNYAGWTGRRVSIAPIIPFELSLVAETARLTIRTVDRSGRNMFVSSSDIILLSEGENEIRPLASKYEPYILTQPYPGKIIKGGVVTIIGRARPVNSSLLHFALIDMNGEILATKEIKLPQTSSYQNFNFDLPYHVDRDTPVRLTVSQNGERLPGIAALSSELITLRP